jgi:hypothetical protein
MGKAGNIQHPTFNTEMGNGEKFGLDGVSLHRDGISSPSISMRQDEQD